MESCLQSGRAATCPCNFAAKVGKEKSPHKAGPYHPILLNASKLVSARSELIARRKKNATRKRVAYKVLICSSSIRVADTELDHKARIDTTLSVNN